ncbi:MAG: c-type cytochrome [Caldilineaceae bacterium]|nr:c-type cytochrome [Caldilineaceae bacterium]
MKLLHRRSLGYLFVLLVLGAMVAGCAPNANAQLVSPQLGAQLYAEEASGEIVIEPTPAPLKFVDLTPEQVTAGLPADFAAALAAADASKGETVALSNGCVGCHSVDPAVTMTGPTWSHLADTAVNRQPGVSPANYIHESIVNPGAYVVPNYPGGVMPAIYGESIPIEDLANLVAYLLTQHE